LEGGSVLCAAGGGVFTDDEYKYLGNLQQLLGTATWLNQKLIEKYRNRSQDSVSTFAQSIMGSGASSFKMASSGKSNNQRPKWLACPTERLLPITEAKFQRITAIGSGKFGFVYLAKHGAQSKCVAIKYISKSFVAECKSVDRIRQEIDILRRLDHPFLIHCYGQFSTPACVALVFEYCSGGELYTFMKKQGSGRGSGGMNEQHAKFYFAEIACALDYLHNTVGVVYRDLKPENILIDCDGHIKLCDFGFAAPAADGQNLRDGCGTAMYVAPEIASGFDKGSHSFPVDWWGLGCVLAEMITGNAPFGDIETTNKFEIFTNITNKSPSLALSMSSAAKTVIRALLDKQPGTRWAWPEVKKCEFSKDIVWDDVLARSITPPWVPKATSDPSSENFVKWESMVLPSKAADHVAASYCAVLDSQSSAGNCRTSVYSSGMESGAPTATRSSSPIAIPGTGTGSDQERKSARGTPTASGRNSPDMLASRLIGGASNSPEQGGGRKSLNGRSNNSSASSSPAQTRKSMRKGGAA